MSRSFLLFFLSTTLLANPVRFDFRDALRRNTVDVVMNGPLERTVAISHFVSGWIEINPEALSQSLKGELEVDMRTFETGTEMKNIFLREKIFEGSVYPTTTAKLVKAVSVSTGRLVDGRSVQMKVEAQFHFKNTIKNVLLPLKLTYYKESEFSRARLPGNLLVVNSAFEIDLASFGVVLPDAVKASAHKTVQVTANFVGSNRLPTGAESIPEGPKPKETPRESVVPKDLPKESPTSKNQPSVSPRPE